MKTKRRRRKRRFGAYKEISKTVATKNVFSKVGTDFVKVVLERTFPHSEQQAGSESAERRKKRGRQRMRSLPRTKRQMKVVAPERREEDDFWGPAGKCRSLEVVLQYIFYIRRPSRCTYCMSTFRLPDRRGQVGHVQPSPVQVGHPVRFARRAQGIQKQGDTAQAPEKGTTEKKCAVFANY